MNQKGFAVTAVIYGLSILGILIITILMGTLSSSRNNVSEEAKRVEKELIAFNKSSVTYTTGQYYYQVPEGETGWYRIEGYGRSILDYKGAFVTGIIYLEEGKILYIDIPEDDTDSIIKINDASGPEILRAAGAVENYSGGTLQPYCKDSLGGNIELDTYKLKDMARKNLVGSEKVTYNPATCPDARTSYLVGYPGSGTAVNVDGLSYYFVDGLMLPAAHYGTGKVTIQLLAKQDDETPTIPRANNKYNGVNALQIINKSGVQITDIDVTSKGNLVYSGDGAAPSIYGDDTATYYFNSLCGGSCNVDDISIVFKTDNHPYINNVEIRLIRSDGVDQVIYKSYNSMRGFTSSPTGIKLSAYQPDSVKDSLPKHGSYYMIPVVSESKVVSARKDSETDSNPIGIEYINGDARQKWEVEEITYKNVIRKDAAGHVMKEYYFTESSRYKSIAIYRDENIARNRTTASMTFNSLSRNPPQIWKITPLGDGTYSIKTVVSSYLSSKKSGYLTVNTSRNDDGTGTDYYEQVMIGYGNNPTVGNYDALEPTLTERFILYALDFSHTRK